MTTAKKPKMIIDFSPIEEVALKVHKVPHGFKDGGNVLYLAKLIGKKKDDKWMRIWHKGRELKVNEVLVCTLISDLEPSGRDCYRIISIQAIYPGGV